ncbi:hypothetical protein J6TS2_25570 [Heyndrickxia sporothermodurans]|nr:hypothetical protein J6TS2_25570 [Heyndrickxia sporothermodurans]
MSRKYLKDISYFDRSTTSTSDRSKMDFRSKYLNIHTGGIALRSLSDSIYPVAHLIQMKNRLVRLYAEAYYLWERRYHK